MKNKWKHFFENYRIVDAKTDSDLLFQIGRSIEGKPISVNEFNIILDYLDNNLRIKKNDVVVDLCCGNGIITFHLSKKCYKVIGIDFSKPYIENAIKLKSNSNIEYYCDDVMNISKYISSDNPPTIYFMYGSIGFFDPGSINILLEEMKKVNNSFVFFIGNIPNQDNQWKFYNNPYRKFKRAINIIIGNCDSIGRWWTKKEFIKIAEKNRMNLKFIVQPDSFYTSYYRFDLILGYEK